MECFDTDIVPQGLERKPLPEPSLIFTSTTLLTSVKLDGIRPARHLATMPTVASQDGRELRPLIEGGGFYECPRWHDSRWWVSDMANFVVLSVTERGEQDVIMETDDRPAGLEWLPDGSLLVVMMHEPRLLRRDADGNVTVHADLRDVAHIANELVVDARGRAYVTGRDDVAESVILVETNGAVRRAATQIRGNGMVITPDGATLIVGETDQQRYSAFTIEANGSLTNRRSWADFAAHLPSEMDPVMMPDGCCLDAEGCVWSADVWSNRCIRVAEGGKVLSEISGLPGSGFGSTLTGSRTGPGIVACMLGGHDGRTMLLCCDPVAFDGRPPTESSWVPRGEASLVTTRVDIPHDGRP
jgi:sugar lactone lactonase YvrE